MAEETQYTANSGIALMTVANSNLDGTTGTYYTVLTAGGNGSLLLSVFIKARVTTSAGMVRLFIDDNTGNPARLIKEIPVPDNTFTTGALNPTFETRIFFDLAIKAGYILKCSTQNAQSTVVVGEALDWAYNANTVRTDTTQYTAKDSVAQVSTANNTLTGGTLVVAYTAGAAASGFKGSAISSITTKASMSVTPGMIRLWIKTTAATKYILYEIEVPTVSTSNSGKGTDQSFEHTIVFDNDWHIPADWSIWASTENAENFNVAVEGNDWKYLAG